MAPELLAKQLEGNREWPSTEIGREEIRSSVSDMLRNLIALSFLFFHALLCVLT